MADYTFEGLVDDARESLAIDYATREERDHLRSLVESGDIQDLAHEYADGHEDVIYYANSRRMWADGVSSDYESDAADLGPHESIDRWITIAAYCTLRAAFTDAVSEYLADNEEEDATASESVAV